MAPGDRPSVDLALAAAVLIAAVALFVGASGLPAPRFEPMGSAAVPRILGGLLALFGAILGGRAAWRLARGAAGPTDAAGRGSDAEGEATDADADVAPNPLRTVAVLVALVLYVAALDVLDWPFVPVTTAFVVALGATLAAPRPRTLAVFAGYGALLAFALHAVFTRFLYVDL